MAHPKQVSIPTAINHRSNHDLTSQHVTTADFMQFNVSKIIEMVPNQTINIKSHECFARLDPMPIPTFGRANIVHRAFFIPMRTIYPAWNDFITDTIHHYADTDTTGIPTNVPYITNSQIASVFWQESTRADFSDAVSDTNGADFIFTNYDSTDRITYTFKGKFTPLGRWAYKLLRSLGITICWQGNNSDPISMLPLLACVRVFYDYYYPSQYLNDSDSSFLATLITRDTASNTGIWNQSTLARLFKILYTLPYANDYFVSAWDTPAGPNNGANSNISINDVTIGDPANEFTAIKTLGSNLSTYGANTPVIEALSANSNISQFAINALKSLSDYMKRHQIVGARAMDRYLSRFGIKLADEKLNRSYLLNEYSQELQFGDVFSTADTDGAALGDYAGKGLSYGNGSISYSTDEYGYLLIISTIVPHVQYYQGKHRMSSHISKLDFYTPEFDNLGTQAIASTELFCPTVIDEAVPSTYKDKVFGFVPRYAEYKIPYSQLTGDLSLNSFKIEGQQWTLFRDMTPFFDNVAAGNIANIQHGINFVKASDASQYNRIFNVPDNNADHFKVIHNFAIESNFPGRGLYDDYEFKDYDKSEHVSVEVGGKTL